MKLVQMPAHLLHVDVDDLPGLGVAPALLKRFDEFRARCLEAPASLAIFGPPAAGTRELLMVLARHIGAALRDENIKLRDRGDDLQTGRKKLCYLPGSALSEALRDPAARRTLEREAACFLQDLDAAFHAGVSPAPVLDLLEARQVAGRPTFLSADSTNLPAELERELRKRTTVIESPL